MRPGRSSWWPIRRCRSAFRSQSQSQITLRGDDVSLLPGATLTSNATGDAIVIAGLTGPMPAASSTTPVRARLLTPFGRWLIYGQQPDPAAARRSALRLQAVQRDDSAASTPAAAGNGLLYSDAQDVTISGGRLQKTYDGSTGDRPAERRQPGLRRSARRRQCDAGGRQQRQLCRSPERRQRQADRRRAGGGELSRHHGRPVFGYTLVSNLLGDITPRPLTLGGVTAQNKVYDGNRIAQVGLRQPERPGGGRDAERHRERAFRHQGCRHRQDRHRHRDCSPMAAAADWPSNYASPAGVTTTADILRRPADTGRRQRGGQGLRRQPRCGGQLQRPRQPGRRRDARHLRHRPVRHQDVGSAKPVDARASR